MVVASWNIYTFFSSLCNRVFPEMFKIEEIFANAIGEMNIYSIYESSHLVHGNQYGEASFEIF